MEYPTTEDHSIKVLRTLVISVLAHSKHETCIEFLKDRLAKNLKGEKQALHPELRGTAFSLFLANSTQPINDFEIILDILKNGSSLDERLSALSSLGSIAKSAPTTLITSYLSTMIFDESIIKPQDFPSCLAGLVSANVPHVNDLVFEWYFANWPKLYKRFSGTMGLLTNTTLTSLRSQIGKTYALKVKQFSTGIGLDQQQLKERMKQLEAVKRPIQQCIESIETNTERFERDNEAVVKWFANAKF